ncbi:DUF5719 family protein [uncultured Serinicoccus sp.]|uniref:DUF5719 family protein n=1 Tax=uncultured Serinicoccus sp. TaxID=735514 RepID=UPI00262953EE|nr:DUF5719 family protein [uncultured Serinicoccus sp.]
MSDDDGSRAAVWLRPALAAAAVAALAWTSTVPGGWGAGQGPGATPTTGPTSSADATADASADASADAGEQALVEQAALACAGREGLPGRARAVTAPEQLLPGDGPGAGSLQVLGPQGVAADPVPLGEAADGVPLAAGDSALVLATGGDAAGLVAGQVLVGAGAEQTATSPRGAALSGCVAPSEDQWVLAGGAEPGRTESLVLTNPGADPVLVDVELRGEAGPVRVTGGAGLVVPAGGRLVRPVDALADGVQAPALRVRAEGGQVAAQLVETYRDGTTELGTTVTSPAAAPARDLVVPPVPSGGDGTDLVLRVLAPEGPAVVELGSVTETGPATPDPAAVRVPAGSTVDVPLAGLDEGVAGLRLRADAPVTASLQVRVAPSGDDPLEESQEATGTGADETAATTEAPAATTEAPADGSEVVRPAGDLTWLPATALAVRPLGIAVPDLTDVPGAEVELSLAALDATTAEVLLRTREGGTTSRTVDLDNDTSALVEIPAGTSAVWVRPGGATMPGLAAALHLTGQDDLGPYRAATTLRAVPWTREVTAITSVVP